jgi:hypothetical protein
MFLLETNQLNQVSGGSFTSYTVTNKTITLPEFTEFNVTIDSTGLIAINGINFHTIKNSDPNSDIILMTQSDGMVQTLIGFKSPNGVHLGVGVTPDI